MSWTRKPASRVVVAAGFVILSACSAEEAGRFDVVFEFEDGGPELGETTPWLQGRVEVLDEAQIEADERRGQLIAEATPVLFGSGAALDFDGVPFGTNRVVVAEIVEGEPSGPGETVLYFGVSDPFDLEPGESVSVPVSFGARQAPRGTLAAAGGQTLLAAPQAELELELAGTTRVQLANDRALRAGVVELSVGELVSLGDGRFRWPDVWSLDQGLCEPCGDGARSVFARLSNDDGFSRVIGPLALVVDTTPPSLALDAGSGLVPAGGELSLELSSSERLAALEVALQGAGGVAVALEAPDLERTSWRWRVPAEELGGEGDYALVATGRDAAGHEVTLRSSALAGDFTAPVLSEPPVVDRGSAGAGQVVVIEIAPSEEIDLLRSSVTLGGVAATYFEDGRWRYQVSGEEAPGVRSIQGILVDRAGNIGSFDSETVVEFDFTPPGLLGTARLERCDGLESARVDGAQDVLWLNQPSCPDARAALRVEMVVDEAVAEGVGVRLSLGDAPLTVTAAAAPNTWIGSYDPLGTETPYVPLLGPGIPVLARLEDPAGNVAELEVGWVRFDFDAPDSPLAGSANAVLLRRPWGTAETGGRPGAEIEISGLEVGGSAALRIVDDPDPQRSRTLATARIAGGEAVRLTLPGRDRRRVFLQLEDEAGNLGPAALVRDVRWHATLGGKTIGDARTNPHDAQRILISPADGTGEEMRPVGLSDEAYAAAALPDDTLAELATPLVWRDLSPPLPELRVGAAAAFDEARQRSVFFGGRGDARRAPLADRVELAGDRLVHPALAAGPAGRSFATLTWHPQRKELLLFGGDSGQLGACGPAGQSRCDDSWRLRDGVWEAVEAPGPGARAGHAVAAQPNRGRLVLFGGEGRCADGSEGVCGDTWEWDGDAWRLAEPVDAPSPRTGHAMTYDPDRGVVLLHGGCASAGGDAGILACDAPLGDLWAYDGIGWSRLDDESSTRRSGHGFVYDEAGGRSVLLGGVSDCASCPPAIAWSGSQWGEVALTEGRGLRAGASYVYDPGVGGVVEAFGRAGPYECGWDNTGDNTGGLCTDLRTLVGHAWEHRAGGRPAPRFLTQMTYDKRRDRVVLVGGVLGEALQRDIWEFGPRGWERRRLGEAMPGLLLGAAGYHEALGLTVVVGGLGAFRQDDLSNQAEVNLRTFTWDGKSLGEVPGPQPPPVEFASMAYDPIRRELVFYGGCPLGGIVCEEPLGETWVLTTEGLWERRFPTRSPPPRELHFMAWDASVGAVILGGGRRRDFGVCDEPGSAVCHSYWLWDGSDWSENERLESGPYGRTAAVLVDDPVRGGVLQLAGVSTRVAGCGTASGICVDVWLRRDEVWTPLEVAGALTGREFMSGAYALSRGAGLVFGGRTSGDETRCLGQETGYCRDIVAFGEGDLRPGYQISVSLGGLLDGREPEALTLQSLRLEALTGGQGTGSPALTTAVATSSPLPGGKRAGGPPHYRRSLRGGRGGP